MMGAINNYPTNTMQTSREACRGPCCLERFLPGPSACGRAGECAEGGPLEFTQGPAAQADPQKVWAGL